MSSLFQQTVKLKIPRTLGVDLSNGERTIKGLDVGSAFGLLVLGMKSIDLPIYSALRSWASQLNRTDSGKGCRDAVVLAELVKAWRSSLEWETRAVSSGRRN